jgi:hypothetical protein
MSAVESRPVTTDTVAEIVAIVKQLPPERQQEVVDFAAFLAQRQPPKPRRPWKSLMGAAATPGFSCSAEDIAEARREMWGNFPREF